MLTKTKFFITKILAFSVTGFFAISDVVWSMNDTTIKGTTSDATASSLVVTNDSDTELFLVRNDGNVGIGISSPGELLQIEDGNVLISNSDGTARRLQLEGTAGGFVSSFRAGAQAADLNYILPTAHAAGVLTNDGAGILSWGAGGGSSTWQDVYDNGNTLLSTDARDVDVTLADTTTDSNFDIDIATGSTSTVSISRADGAGAADPTQLLLVENLDTDRAQPTGLLINDAGGTMTTAIDVSDADIDDAINIGANDIEGTNFDVAGGTGEITVADGAGLDANAADGDLDVGATNADVITVGNVANTTNVNILLDGAAASDFAVDTTALVVESDTDQVGIGLVDPTGQLHVVTGVIAETEAALVLGSNDGDFSTFVVDADPDTLTFTAPIGIGDLAVDTTGTGAIYINTDGSATGWEALTTGAAPSLQTAYDTGNAIVSTDARDVDVTLADTTTDSNFDIDIATGSTSTVSISRADGAGAADPTQLLLVENLDTDRAQPTGLLINDAGGTMTTAIDVSDADIDDAINIGANDIEGTNFDVAGGTGEITVADGAGLDANAADGDLDVGATNADVITVGNVANTTNVNILLDGAAASDFAVDTTALVVESDTDQVGIGLVDPTGQLHVVTGVIAETEAALVLGSNDGDFSTFVVDADPDTLTFTAPIGIGDLAVDTTGTGAIYINTDGSATGWEALTTGAAPSLQTAYDTGNAIVSTDARDVDVTLADTTTDSNFDIDIATGSTSTVSISRADGAGAADPTQLLLVENLDTDRAQPTGLLINDAGGTMTTAIDVSDADIDDAINIGANDIEGTNFDVAGGTGEITVADGAGLDANAADGDLDVGATNADVITVGNVANTTNVNILLDGAAASDFAVDTTALVVESDTDQVGIGLVDPTGQLHVVTGVIAETEAALVLGSNDGDFSTFVVDADPDTLTFTAPIGIGDLAVDTTGTGAIYINTDGSATGWEALTTGAAPSLQTAYDTGNAIVSTDARDVDVTLADTTTDSNFDIDIATGSTSTVSISRADGAGAADPTQLLLVENLDTDRAQPTGLLINDAGGTMTTAIDVSDADIDDAINIGANDIEGTNFDVAGGTGEITVADGAGLDANAADGDLDVGATNADVITVGNVANTTNVNILLDGAAASDFAVDTTALVVESDTDQVGIGLVDPTGQLHVVTGVIAETEAALVLGSNDGDFSTFVVDADPDTLTFTAPIGIGDLAVDTTGTGAIYINTDGSATGWEALTTGAAPSLQTAYDTGNAIVSTDARDVDVTLADTTTDSNFDIDIATGSTSTVSISRADGAGAADPTQLLLVENLDTDRAQPTGLLINDAGGTMTTAIDVSDADIDDAINIGANDIEGTNFDVAGGTGEITVADGAGLDANAADGDLDVGATNADVITVGNVANTTNVNILLDGAAASDFAVDTTALVVESDTDQVGIGLVDPTGQLHVVTGVIAETEAALVLGSNDGDFSTFVVDADPDTLTFTAPIGIGDLAVDTTGTGAIYINTDGSATGWEALTTGAAPSLQTAYDTGNAIVSTDARDVDVTLADTTTDSNFDIDIATGSTSTVSISRADGAGAADPTQLLLVENLDTDRAQPTGLLINDAGGTMTTAIDVSDADIDDAINIGANDIEGTNFDVAGGTGEITVADGAGLDANAADGDLDVGATNADVITVGNVANTTNVNILLDGAAASDFAVDTTALVVESDTDQVGIGLVDPTGQLHVVTGVIAETEAALVLGSNDGDFSTFVVDADPDTLTFTAPIGIGDLAVDTTGTGAIYINTDGSATGWEALTTGAAPSLQTAYDTGNAIVSTDARDVDVTLADTTTDSNFDIDIATGSTSTVSISRADGAGAADPTQLLLVENLDTDRAQPTGLLINDAGGTMTTAIDVSDADIDDAINIGANDIEGTNFDVAGGTGEITVADGAGLDANAADGDLDVGATNADVITVGNVANTTNVNILLDGAAASDFAVDTTALVVESDTDQVGIGLVDPTGQLHVVTGVIAETEAALVLGSNDGDFSTFVVDADPDTLTFTAPIGIGDLAVDTTGTGAIYINTDGSATGWEALTTGAAPSLQTAYDTGNTIVTTAVEGDINIDATGGVDALFIEESNARVGIGTDAPDTDFDISGTVSASPSGVTDIAAAGTLTVTNGVMRIRGAGGVDRTMGTMTAGADGEIVILIGEGSGGVTINSSTTNVELARDVSFKLDTGDTMSFVSLSSTWHEIRRSNN